MLTCAFIIKIKSKQRLKVNRCEPLIHHKMLYEVCPISPFLQGLLICRDTPHHEPPL